MINLGGNPFSALPNAPARAPRLAEIAACLFMLLAQPGASASEPGAAPITNLTMEQAVQIALTNNPRLAEAWANIEAAKGRAAAAGKLPNPDAIARMESAPISSSKVSGAEYVAGISQTIPLGGKRSAARDAARAVVRAREKHLEAAVLDLTRAVRGAFAAALFASDVLALQTNLGASLEKLSRITEARVEQGDAAPLDLARIQAEAARQSLEISEAAYLRREAMHALAAALGDFRMPIRSLEGRIEDVLEIAAMESAAASAGPHPAVAAAGSEAAAQRARLRLARAGRIPDVNLDLFYRRLEGTQENAFDIGVRIPIPLFNRNRGAIREAEGSLRAAEARLARTRNAIGRELRERELALQRGLETMRILKDDILPKVRANRRGAEARYEAGDISLADLLLIRRQAAADRLRYLEAIRSVMEAWAGLSAAAE